MHCTSRSVLSHRLIAACLSALLAAPLPISAAVQQAPTAPQLPDAPAPSRQLVNSETAMAQPPAAVPEGWSSSQAQQAPATQDADRQQNQVQKPVGTAVGPVTQPTGVAGARPSGAAIAPAKQRRVHAFYIRAAIIVAALGATGAVIALSHSSSSRPQ
jgi:hypothetical protein